MNQLVTTSMRGNVTAIIPQSIEDVFRVAKGVVMAGLAPSALVDKKSGDAAVAAVAVAIMSGAELGLKPMVALRSFTVINGRPALYGDGLINVIRQSGRAEYLRTGCDNRDGKLVGWCEAKRADTGEDKRVEFSQDDAVRAGLWSDQPIIKKNGQNGPYEKPNDSPWFRYPQRMLAWRAAGWCLRELFGDVLGGIRDEFEAQEIPVEEQQQVIAPPPPDEAEDAIDVEASEPFDVEAFLSNLYVSLQTAKTEEAVMELWDEHDVEPTLTDDEDALQRAFDIRKDRLLEISAPFPGDQ
ncbi:MAG TPA: hypothetical protein VN155_16815 [Devosia sp.]|nr:hypothetical protein [Devosia sp.]